MHILLISHSMDFTGAPVALLALSRSLRRQGHRVTVAGILPGPITEVFVREGCGLFRPHVNRPEEFHLVIANTVLSVASALAFAGGPERVIAWFHERRETFELFGRSLPNGIHSMHIDKLHWAAFTVRLQWPEYAPLMPLATPLELRCCVDLDLPVPDDGATRPHFVCSGRWEPRKAQSRLVEMLRALGDDQEILFIGCDRPPSVPEPRYRFAGALPPDQARSAIAHSRGVISCSQIETQSLIPIEAAMARRPALLSDIPAHRELKALLPSIILFDTDDLQSFRRGLAALREQWDDAAAREQARAVAREHFGTTAFDRNVAQLLARVLT